MSTEGGKHDEAGTQGICHPAHAPCFVRLGHSLGVGVGDIMVKRALLIAYHYPPIRVSSGLQRTLAFSRYLPENGWEPIMLTPHPRAYGVVSGDQMRDIPEHTVIKRAFALDAARHLSIGGRYLDWTALPDRWASWWLGGVFSGLRLIRRYRPSVIWSTYPIATAHLIALTLHRLTGLPWVADFRDPMTEADYPQEELRRKAFLWIERHTVNACSRAVFTTPSTASLYSKRYPHIPEERWALIPNGYNEEIFLDAEKSIDIKATDSNRAGPLKLVHSGILYPAERDPRPFFAALSELKKEGQIDSRRLKVVLRATAHDNIYRPMLKELNIDDIVELAPGIPYRDALQEMLTCDGLIIFQASGCNHQIPAKLYEYLRAGRPILALTGTDGDTARVLREAGVGELAQLDQKEDIIRALKGFIKQVEEESTAEPSKPVVEGYSRRVLTSKLGLLFDTL